MPNLGRLLVSEGKYFTFSRDMTFLIFGVKKLILVTALIIAHTWVYGRHSSN